MLTIRDVQLNDAQALLDIYAPYVRTTWITFETSAPSLSEFCGRIEQYHFTLGFPYKVAELDGIIAGYAYAHPFHEREAYRFTAETTVYVKQNLGRGGIGTRLYQTVLEDLTKSGFHAAIAILGYPNEASKRFHEKLGFREVGCFHEVGYKLGHWLDTGYLEKILG
ncbi:MAG: GNAT family N-acetyltransferase [Treponema sp.]|jgi:phosphinothricin acetyltransferase|nr:GNAT family N-acetyltransferase [Treponema sp.]